MTLNPPPISDARADGRTSVLLVEDDGIVRAWMRAALEGSEFRVAGEARSAAAALELVERRAPTLLLVDNRLPDGFGTDLVRELRRGGVTAPAVVVTANPEQGLNEVAREAGAQGTLLKSGSGGELLEVLRRVAAGETAFDRRHPARPAGRGPITPRERDALRLAAAGGTNRSIAGQLGVSEETVKTLLARAYLKLGAANRTEAVTAAMKRGLL